MLTILGAVLTALVASVSNGASTDTETPSAATAVHLITIDGAIGPATSHYVTSQLAEAEAVGAGLVILRIDTPGGLSRAMHDIVQAILASPVPVAGYVAPRGARAASAGAYILYATHIAAMAPATHLGAATPVSLSGGSTAPSSGEASKNTSKNQKNTRKAPADISSQAAERRKIINDAVAFLQSLARQRNRNAEWAEAAVRQAMTLTAQQALDKNVIDLMAKSRGELLSKVDGMTVDTVKGSVTLHTDSVRIVSSEPGWQTQLLSVITQPAIAYLLLMIGIVGLLFEGLNPGAVLPGVVGGISLLVALYAFQILPVNYAGLGLIVLGVALMIGEIFAPSFGVLGLGGIAAFIFGSVLLMNTDVPGFETPFGFIFGLSIFFALLILLVIWLFVRSRDKPVHTGSQGLIGRQCVAVSDFEVEGRVWLHGELWLARSDQPVRKDDVLEVVAMEGLTVHVQAAENDKKSLAQS